MRSAPTLLDLRLLPPPEPMRRILDALQRLPRGEHLLALTPMHPLPLLEILDEDGFAYRTQSRAPHHCWLAICHREFADTLDTLTPSDGP